MLFTKCFFKCLPKHVQGFPGQMQIAIRSRLSGPPDWQLWPRQVRDTSNPFHVFSQGLVICNHVLRTSEQSPDLAGYLWKDYHKFSKATAMVCAETREEFTYEQIRHLSLAFGVGLKNLSILNKRGDILAIICPNMPSFAICFYGAVFIHGVPALINPKGCIVAQLRACKPKAVVVLAKDAKHVQYMTEVEEELMSIRTIIISVGVHEEEKLMKDLQPNGPRSPKLLSLREVICNSSKDGLGILSGAPFRPDDIAIVQCLRKANGKEMAVALSHGNIVGTLNQLHVPYLSKAEKAHIIREGHNPMKLFHQETIVGIMPFYTAFGLITGLLSCTKIGGRLITLSEDEPNELLFDILEEYQPTIFPLTVEMLHFMDSHPRVSVETHLDHVKCFQFRIRKNEAHLIQDLRITQMKKKVHLQGCYGATEASGFTHMVPVHEHKKLGSVGGPLAGTTAATVDMNSRRWTEPFKDGEILVRGPQVMHNYLHDQDATKSVFINWRSSKETFSLAGKPWLKTGDIGYYDKHGYFYIVGHCENI